MVKVKITKAVWPEAEPYVGGIYEAFEMDYRDNGGLIDYAVHVDKDKILPIKPEHCEVIAKEKTSLTCEQPKTVIATNRILMVEDGSVDVDELEEWCGEQGIKLIVYRSGANRPEFLI